MSRLGNTFKRLLFLLAGSFFALTLNLATPIFTSPALAVDNVETPTTETTPNNPTDAQTTTETTPATSTDTSTENTQTTTNPQTPAAEDTCSDQAGALAWFICPASNIIAKAIDGIYGIISSLLTVHPIVGDSSSAVYTVWEYIRNITNIVFIVFMVLIIYLQITGLGNSKYNYTIKRALPRLVVSAIVVNLSFYISAIAVDLSNIIGHSLIDFFESIRNDVAVNSTIPYVSWTELITALTVGGGAVFLAVEISGDGIGRILDIVLVALLCALIAVVIGLVVIAMRQALVYLLIMVSPLALIAYLLPNTEHYFKTWQKTFTQMLIFFPMFSILFGASSLAGWVVMGFGGIYLVLGMVIQVVPLVMSISLLKMSGTVLGRIGDGLTKLTNPADSAIRGWGTTRRDVRRAEKLASAMEAHGDRLNPFSVSSWNAWRGYRKMKNAERVKMANDNVTSYGNEAINALKTGRRIIGRNHLGEPVYSSHPIKSNAWTRRETEHRTAQARANVDKMQTDNFFDSLGTHLENKHIEDRVLSEFAASQVRNFTNLRTAQNAATNNTRSNERFYMDLVRKAAETDELGNIKDVEAYNRLIVSGAGADAYSKDDNIRNNAINAVVANAYTAYEKERQENIKRSSVMYSKLKTYDLKQLHNEAWENKDVDNILASMQALSGRGDYDEIFKIAANKLDEANYAMLGSDFTNNLASAFMVMKDDVPLLGRLGKMINMETAHYTFEEDPSKRRCAYFTMREYFTGKDATGMATKRNITNLIPGTSFDRVDRTAFEVMSMGQKLYYDIDNYTDPAEADSINDVAQEFKTNILSNLLSSTLKYDSKSEAMYNSVGYITNMKWDYGLNKWKCNDPRDEHGNIIKSQDAYDYTIEFLKNHSNPAKLCSMKSTAFKGCLARLTIQHDGDEDAAKKEFRQIFEENGVLDTIRRSNPNIIAGMDRAVRDVLGPSLLTPPRPNSP